MRALCVGILCLLALTGCSADNDAGRERSARGSEPSPVVAASPLPTPGPGEVVVPDVTGMPFEQARAKLLDEDLQASKVDRRLKHAPPYDVASQQPVAGSIAKEDSQVRIVVAVPPRNARLEDLATPLQLVNTPLYERDGVVVRVVAGRVWSANAVRQFSPYMDYNMHPGVGSLVGFDVVVANRSSSVVDVYAHHATLHVAGENHGPATGLVKRRFSGLQMAPGSTRHGLLIWELIATPDKVLRTASGRLEIASPTNAGGATIGPPVDVNIQWQTPLH